MARAPYYDKWQDKYFDNDLNSVVNLHQTAEERRAKYWLCRSFGMNSYWSQTMRDWHLPTIEQFLGIGRAESQK